MHVFLGRMNISPLPLQGYCPGTWVPSPVSHFLSLSTVSSKGDLPASGPQLPIHPPLALSSGQGPPTQTQLLLIPASYQGHPIISFLLLPPCAARSLGPHLAAATAEPIAAHGIVRQGAFLAAVAPRSAALLRVAGRSGEAG